MGYLTDYTLSIKKDAKTKESFQQILEEFAKMKEFSNYYCGYDEDILNIHSTTDADFLVYEISEVKWYNHEEELKAMGKKFPEVTFELMGEGEDRYDIWALRVKGDISERKEIEVIRPEFKFNILKM